MIPVFMVFMMYPNYFFDGTSQSGERYSPERGLQQIYGGGGELIVVIMYTSYSLTDTQQGTYGSATQHFI